MSVGFEAKLIEQKDRLFKIRVRPSSMFIRMVVDSVYFGFKENEKGLPILQYFEGPLMMKLGKHEGEWVRYKFTKN